MTAPACIWSRQAGARRLRHQRVYDARLVSGTLQPPHLVFALPETRQIAWC